MEIPLKFHESMPHDWHVGDCWYIDRSDRYLSTEYLSTWKGIRKPIIVCLPNNLMSDWIDLFCIDGPCDPNGSGWTVTGSIETDPITLTVTPSILLTGQPDISWHGYVTNGKLISV